MHDLIIFEFIQLSLTLATLGVKRSTVAKEIFTSKT